MLALPFLLPLLVLVVLLVVLSRGPRPPVTERLGDVARATRRWRVTGMLVGLIVAAVAAQAGALGRGLLLASPLFGLCALLGVLAGELRVHAPAGARRSVTLEVRRLRDYLPWGLASVVGAATVLLGGLLAFTSAIGSADDLGRAGRTLNRACSDAVAEGRGPWPGSYYAWPLAVLIVLGLAVAGSALMSVTYRPRPGEDPAVDDVLRRRAATEVIAAFGLLITVPLAGVGSIAAAGLLRICAAPAAWTAIGYLLLALVPLALTLGSWCAAILIGSGRVEVTAPARS